MRTLAEIKGFGPVRLKALAARGIETALDLVETLPTGYKDTTHPLSPAQMTEGRQACFTGFVKGKPALHRVRGMQWVSATIADAFGAVRCMWFNQPWMKGAAVRHLRGDALWPLRSQKSGLFVINPSLEEPAASFRVCRRAGCGQAPRDAVKLLPDEYDEPTATADTGGAMRPDGQARRACARRISRRILTGWRRLRSGWPTRSCCSFQAGVAGAAGERRRAQPLEIQDAWIEEFFDKLPLRRRTRSDVWPARSQADMRGSRDGAMVQGDVGCGKTLIALCAMYLCVRAGGQAALMAPDGNPRLCSTCKARCRRLRRWA
ncbi:MAG: hypothetical protein ACLS7Z_06215 [Christensenellales bacterium]